MENKISIIAVIGPTASGKSAKAVELARERNGEVISVDSRQVYRGLDIGTEKTSLEEMVGIPHYLIDIVEPKDTYSAGDFVRDANALITDITARGKVPILCGGTHFYFDALLYGLPVHTAVDEAYRAELEAKSEAELYAEIENKDPRRAGMLDKNNKRRLVRALEIIAIHGKVPERETKESIYDVEWVVIDPPKDVLRERLDARLMQTLEKGLVDEVKRVRDEVGDARLNELGLEYKIVGEYLRGELEERALFTTLSNKLWQYARHQKQWLRKLGH